MVLPPQQTKTPKVHIVERIAFRATHWIGSVPSLITHTILFLACFLLILFGVSSQKVFLTLTTIVSLEAIYLSIFIQMSVNRSNRGLRVVNTNIKEIKQDVDELTENVEHIEEGIDEIGRDIEEIQSDVDEIQEDIGEIEEDVRELSEDVEDISEDIEADEIAERERDEELMTKVEATLAQLMEELQSIKTEQQKKKVKSEK